MLEIKSLRKVFIKKDKKTGTTREVGIKGISFSAKPGRIFGLIGANGAGKTTTMRIIADLTYPQSGSIIYNGRPYKSIPELKKNIGFVSGETQIFDRLTPREVMTIYGKLAGTRAGELAKRIAELVEKLHMEEFVDLPSSNFSTGMKQKASIARALVTDPQILVFDEVTNGLDIFAAKALKDLILKLREEGRVILYSTHIMPDADELCDDAAIIHKGEILEEGEVKGLLAKHQVQNLHQLFFKLIDKFDPEVIY